MAQAHDIYKPETELCLRIADFREFAATDKEVESEALMLRGMEWRIQVTSHYSRRRRGSRYVGIFLECGFDGPSLNLKNIDSLTQLVNLGWSCACTATIKIVNGSNERKRNIDQIFSQKNTIAGLDDFMLAKDIVEKGWLQGNSLLVTVHVAVDVPTGVVLNEKARFIGIKNQANTCYINIVVQMLFHTPSFRKALCAAKVNDRVVNALQKLFQHLASSKQPAKTDEFIHSFRGNKFLEKFVNKQDDSHAFLLALIGHFRKTKLDFMVRRNFFSKIDGLGDVFELVLKVKHRYGWSGSIVDAMRTLDFSSAGLVFKELPKILNIYIGRGAWDSQKRIHVTHNCLHFPIELNLEEFMDGRRCQERGEATYLLQKIVTRFGNTADEGHVWLYVNLDPRKKAWIEINDEQVRRVAEKDVLHFVGVKYLQYIQKSSVDVMFADETAPIPRVGRKTGAQKARSSYSTVTVSGTASIDSQPPARPANRLHCAVCVQDFKRPQDLTNHLRLSKKHKQLVGRMNPVWQKNPHLNPKEVAQENGKKNKSVAEENKKKQATPAKKQATPAKKQPNNKTKRK